jgi:AraC-like DNA-binding protein
VIGFLEIQERGLMTIDLMHVRDANRGQFSAAGPVASAALGRLRQIRGGDGGETNSAEYHSIARRPASQSSALRLKLPGAEAVLSISMESNEADHVRGSPTMIDLTESELGGEHLAMIMRWLSERLQIHSDASRPLASSGLTKWRLKRVLTYINEHICESITLATLAQVAGLSRMYFAAQFRAATGSRPHECILRKRIKLAQQLLLETSEPLVSIALAVGFQSQAHFSTVFKRFAGLSPNQWRAANRDIRSLGRARSSEGIRLDGDSMAARCSTHRSVEVPATLNLTPSVIAQFPRIRPDVMPA